MSESRFPWRTLLFLSLAFNLLVIGAVVGAAGAGVRLQREAAGAVIERIPGPRAFLAALPPETRVKMRRELVRSWSESRELRRAAAQARREAFAAASEEPYDAERVRAAFARLREADQAAIAVFHDNVAAAFGALTPEERRQALEALRRAAPASRRAIAPQEEAEPTVAPAEAGEVREQTLRERRQQWRERRRQRLEQRAP
jgi:uncharacterized membrane protein